ncbi:MAG TPA: OmpH family outer membrane protein [Rhizomicrobium sp.]|nr:OmpH family outer membrane protein [Rhizomicrobium sp.]
MSRTRIAVIAGIVLVLIGAAVAGYFFLQKPKPADSGAETAEPVTPGGPVPEARMLVIDMSAVMARSKVGQDIGQQMNTYAAQIRAELDPRGKALQNDGQALQRQLATLSAEDRQKRVAAFEARQNAFRQEAQAKEGQIRAAFNQARAAISQQLEPVIKQLTAQHKANMVVDRQAVPMVADPSLDITAAAVAALDARMPSYKITLPQPGQVQQQAPQQ